MWYKFIKDEFKLKYSKNKELDWLYDNVRKANVAKAYFTRGVCLALRMPKKIIRNNQFLHSVDEGAIQYNNLNMYYINGVRLTEELFNKLSNKKYTFEEWIKETNEEVKAAVLSFYTEKFGNEYTYRFLSKNLTEVNTYVDKKDSKYLVNTTNSMNIGVYTLFKGKFNNINLAYIRCYCPSTDRIFFLSVNPKENNAKDAIASLCQIPKKLHSYLISIKRQGEIFSFNFTEEGINILKQNKLSVNDYKDCISLTGEEYFSKMQYEY